MPPAQPSEIERKPAEVKLPTSRRMALLRRRERGDTRRCDDGRLPRSAKRREHLLRHRRVCSNRSGLMASWQCVEPHPRPSPQRYKSHRRHHDILTLLEEHDVDWAASLQYCTLCGCRSRLSNNLQVFQRKMRWLNENIPVRRLRRILLCWAICRSCAIVKIRADLLLRPLRLLV